MTCLFYPWKGIMTKMWEKWIYLAGHVKTVRRLIKITKGIAIQIIKCASITVFKSRRPWTWTMHPSDQNCFEFVDNCFNFSGFISCIFHIFGFKTKRLIWTRAGYGALVGQLILRSDTWCSTAARCCSTAARCCSYHKWIYCSEIYLVFFSKPSQTRSYRVFFASDEETANGDKL